MKSIVDWSTRHPRMIMAIVVATFAMGVLSYINLPKEGAPNIEIPNYFVSVVYQGISAEDSEKLLVKPLEEELQDLEGLKNMGSTAAEGYAGINLEFDFGLDRAKTLAEIRERVDRAKVEFPPGYNEPSVTEFSFARFPVLILTLSGQVPERTLQSIAEDLKSALERLPPVLEIGLSGDRNEMIEVRVDPILLSVYDITANDLNAVLSRNNLLVSAGSVTTETGSFAVKIPSSFNQLADVENLVIKSVRDKNIVLSDIADIRLTFEDRLGFARHNGQPTLALQVIKKKDTNQIETVELVRSQAQTFIDNLPPELQDSISLDFIQDQGVGVKNMIDRLESAVLTAICVVMIIVLATIGLKSALLVGFAIPTSFLICSIFLSFLGLSLSNMVAFGLILSVGMLVDSAIVVVELADKKMREGLRPMQAYTASAKRMFWPVISSTATTLCAFLPLLFWPGMAGQFMGTLPVTIIFVLSAALIVALVFLPVVGGLVGHMSDKLDRLSIHLSNLRLPFRLALLLIVAALVYVATSGLLSTMLAPPHSQAGSFPAALFSGIGFGLSVLMLSIVASSFKRAGSSSAAEFAGKVGHSWVGKITRFIIGNPVMPVVVIVGTLLFIVLVFMDYGQNNRGVRFFVDSEPERVGIDVLARGNINLEEKDYLVQYIEERVNQADGISSIFSTAGSSGLSGGERGPIDAVGNIQLEFDQWEDRQLMGESVQDSRSIISDIEQKIQNPAGVKVSFAQDTNGPSQGKPLNLRVKGRDWEQLLETVEKIRTKFDETKGLVFVEDTRPLQGIDWLVDIDLEKAASFGADVLTIGNVIRMTTQGVVIDTVRLESTADELDVRVRFPEEYRTLSALENLRIQTNQGPVPASNFLSIKPARQVEQISRHNGERYFEISADIIPGLTNDAGVPIRPNERVAVLSEWLTENLEKDSGITWEWTGDQIEQNESQQFLIIAFLGALGLMFAILLAQFNSFYSSILVLSAVVMSLAGVLIGMRVMGQPFSIVMTGLGVVALAGIVVNHNIVLIDTYNELSRYMPRIKAIVKTIEARIRPVLLTSITTMAGLTPMMLGVSLNFNDGGYTIGAPSSSWWVPFATTVIFGLGTSVLLTLAFTPAMLALGVWISKGAYNSTSALASWLTGRNSQISLDRKLRLTTSKLPQINIDWDQFQQVLMPLPQQNRALENERVVVEGVEVPPETGDESPSQPDSVPDTRNKP